jgi:hypothetical protein
VLNNSPTPAIERITPPRAPPAFPKDAMPPALGRLGRKYCASPAGAAAQAPEKPAQARSAKFAIMGITDHIPADYMERLTFGIPPFPAVKKFSA